MTPYAIHAVIGDLQVSPGVTTDNVYWIGKYIGEQLGGRPNVSIHNVGDHWDFPSLSSYDGKGSKSMEGRRYKKDLAAGDEAFEKLDNSIELYNKGKAKKWRPRKLFYRGNHEERRERAMEADAQLDGVLDDICVKDFGWEDHAFLEPVEVDGVVYSHYFYNPMTSRPYSGENILLRLQKIGHSFTMGHQQGCMYGHRSVGKSRHHGLVLGSSYLHEEKYMGPQATGEWRDYWRGIVICHQVHNGMYDPMFVSLDYLCQRYEGKTLREFMKGKRK